MATATAYTVATGAGLCAISDVGEVLTGTNAIRDGIMGGNQEAYDTTRFMLNMACLASSTLGSNMPSSAPATRSRPAVAPANAPTINTKSADAVRTPQQAGISNADARRIQNAANRTNQDIHVVGSRANGKATITSDWDYVMSGNSSQRHSAMSSVPHGSAGGGNNTGIDIFTNYRSSPFYEPLDKTRPYVPFRPQ